MLDMNLTHPRSIGLALIAATAMTVACTKAESPTKGEADAKPETKQPPVPEDTEPDEGRDGIACTSDLDCKTCGTKEGCGCVLEATAGDACGPSEHPCYAPPCLAWSGSCWEGTCRMRPGGASPCETDDQCAVRVDTCNCSAFAAVAGLPEQQPRCDEPCSDPPSIADWKATCDPTAKRCVLAAADPLPTPESLGLDLDAMEVPASIERDRIDRDAALLIRYASVFPLGRVDRLEAAFTGENAKCTARDQGFGITSHYCTVGGGYASCRVSGASAEGRMFEAQASCRISEKRWDTLEPIYGKVLEATLVPKGFSRNGHHSGLAFRDEAHAERAQAMVSTKLSQKQSGTVPPPELEKAFSLLTSPWQTLTVGTACGAAGSPPLGNGEMQALVKGGRADLLRDVLRGMNPAGRLYGYIGLRLLGENTAGDDATYDDLSKLDVKIDTCGGCMVTEQTAETIEIDNFRAR